MGYKADAAKGLGAGAILLIVIGLIGLIIGGIFFTINVLLAPAKGQGEATMKKYSAENWTKAQAKFEDLYAGIQASDRKIDTAYQAKTANPTDLTLSQQYSGIVSGCFDLVKDYNAESRKFLAEDFKSTDLPYQINQSDSRFDCKENTK